MKIKETRMLDVDSVMHLCISKNWYTRGNNAEYTEMLEMCNIQNVTNNRLYKIAKDIKEHSNTEYEITSIMFELVRMCSRTFFEIEE